MFLMRPLSAAKRQTASGRHRTPRLPSDRRTRSTLPLRCQLLRFFCSCPFSFSSALVPPLLHHLQNHIDADPSRHVRARPHIHRILGDRLRRTSIVKVVLPLQPLRPLQCGSPTPRPAPPPAHTASIPRSSLVCGSSRQGP